MINAAQPNTDIILRRLATLSDPTRLRLLRVLERAELGVSDLCDVLQLPQSTISRHLKVLADEHWLTHRRRGTTNLYRLLLDELDPSAREQWLLVRRQTDDWSTFEHDALRLAAALERHSRDSQKFFASAAGRWDETRDELYGKRFLVDSVSALLPSDWTVADLGCGTGTVTAALARSVERVVGVDNSQPMLTAAKQRLSEFDNVSLKHGDLESLPLDDATCDAALAVLVLTYVPAPIDVIHEAARILKPGGKFVVVDLLRHDQEDFRRSMNQLSRGFGCDELADLFTDAGFDAPTCTSLPPEHDAKGPALVLAHGRKAASPDQNGKVRPSHG